MISDYFLNLFTDLITICLKKTDFLCSSGLQKMLKILIEILVRVFHDNFFFGFIGLMAILRLSASGKKRVSGTCQLKDSFFSA